MMSNNFNKYGNSSSVIRLNEICEDDNSKFCDSRHDKPYGESNRGDFSQNLREKDFHACDSERKVFQEYHMSHPAVNLPQQKSPCPSQQSMCLSQPNVFSQQNPVQPMYFDLKTMSPAQKTMFMPKQNAYIPQQIMCPPQQNMFPPQQTTATPNFCHPQTQDSSLSVYPPYQLFPPNNLNFGPVNTSVPPPTMYPTPIAPSQYLQPSFNDPCTSQFLPNNQPFSSGPSPDKQSVQYWNQMWSWKKSVVPKTVPTVKISVSGYRDKVVHLSSQIKELEKLSTHLQIMCKSLNDEEWHSRKSEVENQKVKVEEALNDVKIIPLPEIQQLLKKRQNKRKYLKRKREEYKEIKKENKAICQLEHSRIDAWLEKMEEQVERARREKGIKKQADYVLSEVFHKKAEAKRMLSLLTTLGKLRNARIHDRESKGEFVSKEAAESFNSIIENLKKRWISQINGYNLEEQGLRVMLNDAEIKRSNIEKSLNKQILQQWMTVIFGENRRDNSFQPNNVEELIYVRQCWDQFITNEDNLIGSSIPNGWILPSLPSNDDWARYVKRS